MRLQRTIASLLLSVLFLTPLAPAFAAPIPAVAPHCVRPPLAPSPTASGMQCHEAMGHGHSLAAADSSKTTPDSDRQLRSNGCCTSHDCCNSTVRAQWANSVAVRTLATGDVIHLAGLTESDSTPSIPQFDTTRGRAPPIL